ncbi:PPIL3 isoform 4 [Pan troglodytes]|uniref:Peptidylprolyl isomerase like 3 n=3 Tax=Hominidae TaxID=9604 RepID=F8WC82_HUMAN|nr:peptidylprolyl isomerase like 3 [Homo sapiens]KAI4037548.1 peptidylprolyl isomerase like 3 [Homo sapiens]PNI66843.1 PPIL3 isoform 4 [Pan troglodytes]PNJ73691.1 PPIL3 isoform 14 [Pongo abelii]
MSVTLHTDVGDIKIEVFCERTPKTCEEYQGFHGSNRRSNRNWKRRQQYLGQEV